MHMPEISPKKLGQIIADTAINNRSWLGTLSSAAPTVALDYTQQGAH